jgi:hypothetical protein
VEDAAEDRVTPGEKQLELTAILENLNDDERNVVLDVALGLARRMFTGRQRYAPLDLATDRRDWVGEATEEMLDGAAYLAMALVQRAHRRAP